MKTKNKSPLPLFHVSIIFVLFSLAQFCNGVNTIRQGETIIYRDTLLSEDENFELGFFSPGNSTSRFVGIWYKIDVQTISWTANRDNPISDRNGVLRIGIDDNLVVLDGNNPVWSSNVSVSSNNTAAILQNSGNFVLFNNDTVDEIDTRLAHWQSFNHPTDTFLPGMRVSVNYSRGEYKMFTSWKSENDPSPGNYSVGIDPTGGPQIVIRDRTRPIWRSGQQNSMIFTGVVNMINCHFAGYE